MVNIVDMNKHARDMHNVAINYGNLLLLLGVQLLNITYLKT